VKCKICKTELLELPRARGISGYFRDFLATQKCPKCGTYYDEQGRRDEP